MPPLDQDQKQQLAERLARGEDVTITLGGEDMTTSWSGDGETGDAQGQTSGVDGETETGVDQPLQDHGHHHAPPLNIDLVINRLAQTIADQAVKIAVLEAQLIGG